MVVLFHLEHLAHNPGDVLPLGLPHSEQNPLKVFHLLRQFVQAKLTNISEELTTSPGLLHLGQLTTGAILTLITS